MNAELSWLERRHPAVKLAWSAGFAVSATVLAAPTHLAVLLALALLPWLVWRPAARWLGALATLAALASAGMVVSQGLFWNGGARTVLVDLPLGLSVSQEGLLYGAGQSIRAIAVAAAALLVVAASDPGELLEGLTSLGLPTGLAFMLVLAVRFLPDLFTQGQRILAILQLRGTSGPLRRAALLTTALLACLLRQARQMALAADARGWTPEQRRTPMAALTTGDWLVLVGLLVLLAVAIAIALGVC